MSTERLKGYYWVELPKKFIVDSAIELAFYDPKREFEKWSIIGEETLFDDDFFNKIGSNKISLPDTIY